MILLNGRDLLGWRRTDVLLMSDLMTLAFGKDDRTIELDALVALMCAPVCVHHRFSVSTGLVSSIKIYLVAQRFS